MDELEYKLRWACRWARAKDWTIRPGVTVGFPRGEPSCCPLGAAALLAAEAEEDCAYIGPVTAAEIAHLGTGLNIGWTSFAVGFDKTSDGGAGTYESVVGRRLRDWVDAGMPDDEVSQ